MGVVTVVVEKRQITGGVETRLETHVAAASDLCLNPARTETYQLTTEVRASEFAAQKVGILGS